MVESTIDYYQVNSKKLVERYEKADVEYLHSLFLTLFKPSARILELGCGSGRDAAWLLRHGFSVECVDGSESMLKHAALSNPELQGLLHHVLLPAQLPFETKSFDGFYTVACLMHLNNKEVCNTMLELSRVVKDGANGLVSVPAERRGIDKNGFDSDKRFFNIQSFEKWSELIQSCGFIVTAQSQQKDGLERNDFKWLNITVKKL